MKTKFEFEGKVLHTVNELIFPPKSTLVWIKGIIYSVEYCVINLDKNYNTVELIKIN